jgi:DNA-binding PadR family transcriptional regulator
MDPHAHLPLSPRDFLVLLVLADGPLHGYGILAAVEERVGDEVPLDPANLYRALKRMRRDEIVEEVEPPDPDAPLEQRRYFGLTALGRAVAAAEARRLAALTAVAAEARLLDADAGSGSSG